ncbi:patched family domain-containing protein [Ditylenchus destructor]|uniref:Patched family domain-containing protein n=1 Tax=Ditylenchus destructor TaxID=166010 RepID=A0AAD4QZY9_9BILA|nr:patched family domain-containing protein [Ditylenchus destructor]
MSKVSPEKTDPFPMVNGTPKHIHKKVYSNAISFSALLNRRVQRFYRWWAHFVSRNAWRLIVFCIVLTIICGAKMVTTKRKNNIRGYTPYGSRALHEFDVRDEFFNQNGFGFRFFVLLVPKDNSTSQKNNMLTEEALEEAVEVDDFIQNNFTIYNHVSKEQESFNQICRRFCTINEPVRLFHIGLQQQNEQLQKGEPLNRRIILDYPTMTMFGQEVSLQPNFFGIHFWNETTDDKGNLSNETALAKPSVLRSVSNMARAEMIVLLYRAERIGGWSDDEIMNYEMNVSNYFKNEYVGKHLRVMTISTSYVNKEVERAGKLLMPFVGIGFLVMSAFSLLTCTLAALYMKQVSVYRMPLTILGCICPFMASCTALGLLFFAGLRNSSILGVVPFLLLAIGVDDAFLTIHAWQKLYKRDGERKPGQSVDEFVVNKLAMVLEDTGPAILISALTNILADSIGAFTGSPEITLLCVANIMAIAVDFLFHITFFCSFLAILAKREELSKQANELDGKKPLENGSASSGESDKESGNFKSTIPIDLPRRDHFNALFNTFVDGYVKVITNSFVALIVCIFWTCLIVVCFRGMLNFEINLTTQKLFPRDSPLLEIENLREEKILPFYSTAQLFINKPGNLSDPVRRSHLDQLVQEMESLPYAYGDSHSTMHFLRDFEIFSKSLREDDEAMDGEGDSSNAQDLLEGAPENATLENSAAIAKIDTLPHAGSAALSSDKENVPLNVESDLGIFLAWPEYGHWKGLLNYHKEDPQSNGSSGPPRYVVDSFMITVAYRGHELKEWSTRAHQLGEWRRVVDKYADEFNVTVLHDDGLYLDLLENMITDIWQSLLGTLFCMAGLCAVFMFANGGLLVVIVAVCVIASVMIVTLGLLALNGLTMDPVVMAAVIVAIGFSVDQPTHVAYHFYTAEIQPENKKSKRSIIEQRVRHSFHSVGWPAIQASSCTAICILCLLLVPLYIASVFAQVMCLAIILCAIHSLVLLPAMLTLPHKLLSLWHRRSDTYDVQKQQPSSPQ